MDTQIHIIILNSDILIEKIIMRTEFFQLSEIKLTFPVAEPKTPDISRQRSTD